MTTWRRSGWLPALEVARWDRLDHHRELHEGAIAALEAEQESGSGADTFDALLDVVEAATVDLSEHHEELEAALAAAVPITAAYVEALGRDRQALDRLWPTLIADRLHHGRIVQQVLVEIDRAREKIAA
jgi:hypothetical protein